MSPASPDRRRISSQRTWLLTALVGVQLWAALASLPAAQGRRTFATEAAVLCAVLAVFGLRSVPIRWIVRGLGLLSGLLLARFGELGPLDGPGGSWKVLVWLVATAGALSLSPSSRSVVGRSPATVFDAAAVPPPDAAARRTAHDNAVDAAGERTTTGRVPLGLVLAAACLVVAASLLAGPRVSSSFPTGASAGELADQLDNRSGNSLLAQDRLDMTSRPSLTPRVVMTVRSPLAAFWRVEAYDVWDGATWTRSDRRFALLADGSQVTPAADDVAAVEGQESEQEFRMEIGYATAVPSAASPVRIDSADQVAQRSDGTLVMADRPLSKGSTFSVTSRQVPTSAEKLSATDHADVPAAVLDRYAAAPVATRRTAELVDQVTGDIPGDFAKVQALERWMNDNTTYSLESPLAPEGVDVVDHFLFESRTGWCEQIASSLVVMARLAGVPARLATGFTPGEWDAVGGRFVVRERDAHAWAEVWFPEHGWITFDPTADVPLAGTTDATPGARAVDWREVLGLLLAVSGTLLLVAAPLRRSVRSRQARRLAGRTTRRLEGSRWDVAEERRIERLGADAGRPREPSETVSTYARSVAVLTGDDELVDAGRRIDRFRYGPAEADGSSGPARH